MARSLVQRSIDNALEAARAEVNEWSDGLRTSCYYAALRTMVELIAMRDAMEDGSKMDAGMFNQLPERYKDMIDRYVQDNGIHPASEFGNG